LGPVQRIGRGCQQATRRWLLANRAKEWAQLRASLLHRSIGGRRDHVQIDQLESEAGDPLQESLQGALVW